MLAHHDHLALFLAQISALPLLDPLVPGRMESMPNRPAFVPQFGTSLSNNMVSPARLHVWVLLPLLRCIGKLPMCRTVRCLMAWTSVRGLARPEAFWKHPAVSRQICKLRYPDLFSMTSHLMRPP